MPIIHFHLADQTYSEQQQTTLMTRATALYSQLLNSPVERVRVYIQPYAPSHLMVGGRRVADGAADAPYFHFLVLEDRPLNERHALLAGFTDLLVECLGVERGRVRGGCWPIAAEDWAIGGTPASVARAAEVAARAAAAAAPSS